jgi:flagellar biogenesis protein FliO
VDSIAPSQVAPDPLAGVAWLGEVFFAVLAIGLLVWVGLRLYGRSRGGLMRVVARLPLEGRRSLYLVEAAGSFLLIGAGEGGLSTRGELYAEKVRLALAAGQRDAKPLSARLLELWKQAGGKPG